MQKEKRSRWLALIVSLFVTGVILFCLISTATAPSSLPDDMCSDGGQNALYTCNNGAGYGDVPFVQCYVDCVDTVTVASATPIIMYRGVNLAGGEFEDDAKEHEARNGVFLPFDNDAALFIYKGMNTFRIPIAWEYFATKDGKNVYRDSAYYTKLNDTIAKLTKRGATVLIDVHNYMRYNADNVTLDATNTDPEGDDVIKKLFDMTSPLANLWTNIIIEFERYSIVCDVMNAPHHITSYDLGAHLIATINAIRRTEKKKRHLLLLPGNYYSALNTWFASPKSNADAYWFAERNEKDEAVQVHMYFDVNGSGQYIEGECVNFDAFKSEFDDNWAEFKGWVEEKQKQVFVTEFGAPDTPNCRRVVRYFLDALSNFAYDKNKEYGVIGWTVWAAGSSWGPYPLSIAPGGRANNLMWNHSLYENYLVPINKTIPPLATLKKALAILYQGRGSLVYMGGYVPFQLQGSADISANSDMLKLGAMYSNNERERPIDPLRIVYAYSSGSNMTNRLTFGYGPKRDGSPDSLIPYYSNYIDEVTVNTTKRFCQAITTDPDDLPRCFIVQGR